MTDKLLKSFQEMEGKTVEKVYSTYWHDPEDVGRSDEQLAIKFTDGTYIGIISMDPRYEDDTSELHPTDVGVMDLLHIGAISEAEYNDYRREESLRNTERLKEAEEVNKKQRQELYEQLKKEFEEKTNG